MDLKRQIRNYLAHQLGDSPYVELDQVAKGLGSTAYMIRKELKDLWLYKINQVGGSRGPYIITRSEVLYEGDFVKFLVGLGGYCNYEIKCKVDEQDGASETVIHLEFSPFLAEGGVLFTEPDQGPPDRYFINVEILEHYPPPSLEIKVNMGTDYAFKLGIATSLTYAGTSIKWYKRAKEDILEQYNIWRRSLLKGPAAESEDSPSEEFRYLEYIDELRAYNVIKQIIRNATEEILIVCPLITDPRFLDLIEDKKEQFPELAIKIITRLNGNETNRRNMRRSLQRLEELGVELRTNEFNKAIHDKIYVNEREAVIGSFNATLSGLNSNSESGIYVSDQIIVNKIRLKFTRLWESLESKAGKKVTR